MGVKFSCIRNDPAQPSSDCDHGTPDPQRARHISDSALQSSFCHHGSLATAFVPCVGRGKMLHNLCYYFLAVQVVSRHEGVAALKHLFRARTPGIVLLIQGTFTGEKSVLVRISARRPPKSPHLQRQSSITIVNSQSLKKAIYFIYHKVCGLEAATASGLMHW